MLLANDPGTASQFQVQLAGGLLQAVRVNKPYYLKARDLYVEETAEGLLRFILAGYSLASPYDIRAVLGAWTILACRPLCSPLLVLIKSMAEISEAVNLWTGLL